MADVDLDADGWQVCTDPEAMLVPFGPTVLDSGLARWVLRLFGRGDDQRRLQVDRKLRLFACACCRRIWSILSDESRKALSVAETFADRQGDLQDSSLGRNLGEAARQQFIKELQSDLRPVTYSSYPTWRAVSAVTNSFVTAETAVTVASRVAQEAANAVSYAADPAFGSAKWNAAWAIERQQQADLLRHIFGNPFRPVAIDLGWLTSNVIGIAQGIHEKGAWERMPILADALEDAGCPSADILDHCRQPGEHVKGCWLIDRLLGKS